MSETVRIILRVVGWILLLDVLHTINKNLIAIGKKMGIRGVKAWRDS